MRDTIEKKRLEILKILNDAKKPVNSNIISHKLMEMGNDISERTVRFDLLFLDKEGFTEYIRKKGRIITEKGKIELERARVFEKVGFLSSKIDRLTYKMNFNLAARSGSVVLNLSLMEEKYIDAAIPLIASVFETPYAMGKLMALFFPGGSNKQFEIPAGQIGIGTVCSVTVNGILLNHGIPVRSCFGGLLEIQEHKPTRFVAIINYDGTSLDPLEIFIKSRMTDYSGVVARNSGLVGASFREMPEESRDQVLVIAEKLKEIGLGAFLEIGYPGKAVCEVPVSEGTFGCIVMGGLNPVAILEESGIPVDSKALSGIFDFNLLFPYQELTERIMAYRNKTGVYS